MATKKRLSAVLTRSKKTGANSSKTNAIFRRYGLVTIVVVVFAAAGAILYRSSQAASFVATTEAESGTVAGNAVKQTGVSGASGSGTVKFQAGTTPPPGPNPPTPPPNPNPSGRLIWSDAPAAPVGANHQNNPFPNWERAEWNFAGGATATVVSDPVKGKAIRFFGPANGSNGSFQRGELVPTYDSIQPGEQLWLAYDLWVDSPLSLARAHQQLWQIKSAPSEGSPTFAVNINNHRDGLVTGNNGTLFAPTPYNKWVRLIFGFNVTTSSSSWMEIWQDGKQVLPRYSTGALYRSGDRNVYLKLGVYRAAPKPYDITMRMANFKLGTTKAIVE